MFRLPKRRAGLRAGAAGNGLQSRGGYARLPYCVGVYYSLGAAETAGFVPKASRLSED